MAQCPVTPANCFGIILIYAFFGMALYYALSGTITDNFNYNVKSNASDVKRNKSSIQSSFKLGTPPTKKPEIKLFSVSTPLRRRLLTLKKPHPDFSPVMETPHLQNVEEIATASKQIQILNEQQMIYNLDIFGPVTETTNVIVIQTHTRLAYIDALTDSLSNVRGINDSLLIFSHDVIMPSMNAKIQGIRFARVMQIFYPYSIQLHPDRFPGPDPSDKYSNTWNPQCAQMKLHWWWKASFVFDQIKVLKNYSRVVSFTEEDAYFASDALWMLNLMEKSMTKNECGGCGILSISEKPEMGIVTLKMWGTSEYPGELTTDYTEGLVMPAYPIPGYQVGFNRTIWEQLKKCSSQFCEYNDYNWDLTLGHVMELPSCMKEPLKLYLLRWPRVFHTGGCGFHRNDKTCDPNLYVSRAKKMYESYGSQRFPVKLGKLDPRKKEKSHPSFGGMGNPKIVELCKSIVQVSRVNVSEAVNQTIA